MFRSSRRRNEFALQQTQQRQFQSLQNNKTFLNQQITNKKNYFYIIIKQSVLSKFAQRQYILTETIFIKTTNNNNNNKKSNKKQIVFLTLQYRNAAIHPFDMSTQAHANGPSNNIKFIDF